MANVNCDKRRNIYTEVANALVAVNENVARVYSRDELKDDIEYLAIGLGIVDENRTTSPHWLVVVAVLEDRGCLKIIRASEQKHFVSMNCKDDRYVILQPERPRETVSHPPGSYLLLDGNEIVKVLYSEVPNNTIYTCRTLGGVECRVNAAEHVLHLVDMEKFELA